MDLLVYLSDWFGQLPDADLNGDGAIDAIDLVDFLEAWWVGLNCP